MDEINVIKTKFKQRLTRLILPFVAAILTRFPYTTRVSRFLDKLYVLADY
jgi:hypothetical protein